MMNVVENIDTGLGSIEVEFRGPTDHSAARFICRSAGKWTYFVYDYQSTMNSNFAKAAMDHATKRGWVGKWRMGWNQKGAAVFTGVQK